MNRQEANRLKPGVSYLRVSTDKQGNSGLGLEAQRASVQAFAQATGYEIVSEYVEVESGKIDSRPILKKALAHAKKLNGCLVVARLDRLARSVRFIAELMDANVDFRAVDMPEASKFVLQIMSCVGEQEAKACSDRTKAALKAAKARGVLLGGANPKCRNLPKGSHLKGGQTLKTQARNAYLDIQPKIAALKTQGLSLQAIADTLNSEGHVTRTGRAWFPMQVSRAMQHQG